VVAGALVHAATPNNESERAIRCRELRYAESERLLSDLGYWTGPVDGVLDGKTRQALIAFQKFSGIEATGRLNRESTPN